MVPRKYLCRAMYGSNSKAREGTGFALAVIGAVCYALNGCMWSSQHRDGRTEGGHMGCDKRERAVS